MPKKSIVPSDIVRDRRLRPNDVLVLLCFGHHVARDGGCIVRHSTIAGEVGLTRRSTIRIVRRLIEFGYLVVERRTGGDGADLANRYRIVVPDVQGALFGGGEGDSGVTRGGDSGVTGGVTPTSHPGSDSCESPLEERPLSERKKETHTHRARGSHRNRIAEARTAGQRELLMPRAATGRERPAAVPVGHRIPPDWHPDELSVQWTVAAGVPADAVAGLVDAFRDHWLARGGPEAIKADWAAAWRTWVRIYLERSRQKEIAHEPQRHTGTADRRPGRLAEADRLGDAFANLRTGGRPPDGVDR